MAEPDRNSFAEVWEQLDPMYAERVRVTEATALGDEEIVRRWPQIGEGYLSKCVTALSLFTDSTNSKPQLWVKDPIVGRETFHGIYRSVTVDVDTQKPGLKGIIQTLRKGFATTPQWAEARVQDTTLGPANSNSVTGLTNSASDSQIQILSIRFPNCSPDSIESISRTLGTQSTHSDIVIRGETYAGEWHTISAATKIEDDGSGTVLLQLAHPQFTMLAYESFGTERHGDIVYLFDVPRPLSQGIIDGWKLLHPKGSSATCSYSSQSGLVDITLRVKTATPLDFDLGVSSLDCRYIETMLVLLGTGDSGLLPIPEIIDGMGISYTRRANSNGDGTWDIYLTKRTVQYRDATGLIIEQSAGQMTTQRQQLGLTTQARESMDEEIGAIKTQRIEIRDDCSKDVTTQTETGKELSATETVVAKSYREASEHKSYQGSELAVPAFVPGHVVRVKNEDSKYPGKFDTSITDREILSIDEAVRYDSADDAEAHGQVIESLGVKNTGGLEIQLAANAGESLQATVQFDKESDTLDVRKLTVTGKEQTTTRTATSGASTEVVTEKTFQSAELPPAPVTTGKIVRHENRASKYTGRVDTVQSEESGVEQVDVTMQVSAGATETVTEKTFQSAPLNDPAPVDGHIKSVKNATSKYPGMYDTQESDKEVLPLDSVARGGTVLFDEEVSINQNANADQASGVSGSVGVSIDAVSRKNDAGRFDNQTTKRTAKPYGPVSDLHGSAIMSEQTDLFRNQDAMPNAGPAPQGQRIDVAGNIGELGKIDYVKTTVTGIPFEDGPHQTGADAFSTEQTTVKGNQLAITETFPADKIKNVTVRVNELKLLDATVQEKTPIAVVTGPFVSEADGYKQAEVTKFHNAPTIPVAAGKGQRVDASPSEFPGRFNAVKTVVSATEFYIDFNEPAVTGKNPAFHRIIFGILDSTDIQSRISEWFAIVQAQTNEQYSYGCAVSRDGDGFYQLTMSANPKAAGGGSVEWDNGFDFETPVCGKASDYKSTYAQITFTTSALKVQSLFDNAKNKNVVAFGAGGATGVQFQGRGRYKVTLIYGVN